VRSLPSFLMIVAAISLLIGLLVRVAQTAVGAVRPAFLDPVFYWRGGMALLTFAICILLLQIRNSGPRL
jgi:hypothetical protein